jgi:hypothetical protein
VSRLAAVAALRVGAIWQFGPITGFVHAGHFALPLGRMSSPDYRNTDKNAGIISLTWDSIIEYVLDFELNAKPDDDGCCERVLRKVLKGNEVIQIHFWNYRSVRMSAADANINSEDVAPVSSKFPYTCSPLVFDGYVFESWIDLPLNFHPAVVRASANVTPLGAVSVPA